jgi:hypothetical protein
MISFEDYLRNLGDPSLYEAHLRPATRPSLRMRAVKRLTVIMVSLMALLAAGCQKTYYMLDSECTKNDSNFCRQLQADCEAREDCEVIPDPAQPGQTCTLKLDEHGQATSPETICWETAPSSSGTMAPSVGGSTSTSGAGGYSGGYENPAPGNDGTPDCVPGQGPVYVGSNDPNGLDGDGDGWGCE